MTGRKRRVVETLVGLIIAAALSGSSQNALGHENAVPTTVEIRYTDDPAATNTFSGRVISADFRCEAYRTVKLYRVRRGADALVATTLATETGFWAVESEDPRDGTYYVRVTRRIVHQDAKHNHTCLGVKSENIAAF